MGHLDEEDLVRIGLLLDERILQHLSQSEKRIMATLAQLVTDDTDLASEVAQLIAAYEAVIAAQGAGTLTAEQQAQVDAADATLQSTKASVVAALTPPAPVTVAFVAKVEGEAYADYVNRVNAWNVDPANVDGQITAADEASWDALPVG